MAPVRFLKWRVLLFVVVETLGIATMTGLLKIGQVAAHWPWRLVCSDASAEGLLLGIGGIFAGLALLCAVLRLQRPVWGHLVGLGVFAVFVAWIVGGKYPGCGRGSYAEFLVAWHLAAAVLVGGVGLIGGAHAAFVRLRRFADDRARARRLVPEQP